MVEKMTNQWHETHKVEEDGVSFFLKKYHPNSYEIKNEVSWLLSRMLKSCTVFDVPDVFDFSINKGEVRMGVVDDSENPGSEKILEYLVEAAVNLHDVIKSDKPYLRTAVGNGEYPSYLQDYVDKRIKTVSNFNEEFSPEIGAWINSLIDKLSFDYFTIVHRDMRSRHLLFPEGKKPVLIDWEFANISDPAQDLAKIIYDSTVSGMKYEDVRKKVIDMSANLRHMSIDEMEERIMTFLPIIPLEHAASFVARRPNGYEEYVLKDLYFIRALYEEKN